MVKKSIITVKDTNIRTMTINGIDYVCITDIARQKNAEEPKDVVKNWMRLKNTIMITVYPGYRKNRDTATDEATEFSALSVK